MEAHDGTNTGHPSCSSTPIATSVAAASSPKKRKQPDEDEQVLVITPTGPLDETPIENEYEHLDDDDDDYDGDVPLNDEINETNEKEYQQILRAQKSSTITHYDDIKITPFNLDDELEEGEFDSAGNFIFRREKEKDENKNDTWAESVDWSAVEKLEQQRQERAKAATTQSNPNTDSNQSRAEPEPARDKISSYRQMLRLMRADETVQRTIRRLGNDVPKRRPQKRDPKNRAPTQTTSASGPDPEEARKKLDLMIELAHHRLEDGDTDIYQKSYDDLEDAIN